MSWINSKENIIWMRSTKYNNSVVCRQTTINNIVDTFDTALDFITNFTEEIASLTLYPIKLKVVDKTYKLETARLTYQGSFKPLDTINCYRNLGEIFIEPKFNNFADYKGYTIIKLFLPLVGYVDIDPNECMGRYLQIRLKIDFYTGKGMYIVGVSDYPIRHTYTSFIIEGEDQDLRVISVFECDIGIEIPLGKTNIGDIKRNLLLGTIKTAAAVTASTYTMSLPAPTTTTSTVKTYDIQGRSTAKGSRMKQLKSGTVTTEKTTSHHRDMNISKPISQAIDGSLDTLNRFSAGGSTDRVNDSGLMSGVSLQPKVIIYRPKIMPTTTDYDFLVGKPVGAPIPLNKVSGYTEISNIHLEGNNFASATSNEIAEIESILLSNNGIILPGENVELNSFRFFGNIYNYLPNMYWRGFITSGYNINNNFRDVGGIVYFGDERLKTPEGNDVESISLIDKSYYTLFRLNYFILWTQKYYFIPNTSWANFIDSSYNINGKFTSVEGLVYYDGTKLVTDDRRDVLTSDYIIPTTYRQ